MYSQPNHLQGKPDETVKVTQCVWPLLFPAPRPSARENGRRRKSRTGFSENSASKDCSWKPGASDKHILECVAKTWKFTYTEEFFDQKRFEKCWIMSTQVTIITAGLLRGINVLAYLWHSGDFQYTAFSCRTSVPRSKLWESSLDEVGFYWSISGKRKAKHRWEIGPRSEVRMGGLSPCLSFSLLPARDFQFVPPASASQMTVPRLFLFLPLCPILPGLCWRTKRITCCCELIWTYFPPSPKGTSILNRRMECSFETQGNGSLRNDQASRSGFWLRNLSTPTKGCVHSGLELRCRSLGWWRMAWLHLFYSVMFVE